MPAKLMELTTKYVTIILLLTLALIWISPDVEAVAELDRVKKFLGQTCSLIREFLNPFCSSSTPSICCTLFTIVDICRTSCTGDFDPLAMQSLSQLLGDANACRQIQQAGVQACDGSDSVKCRALQCFMNLACFEGRTSCDDELLAELFPVAAFSTHHQTRVFELPEQAACEATDLVKFNLDNMRTCPISVVTEVCGEKELMYRTIDGRCNNLNHPDWGKSFTPVKRYLDPVYQDGINLPRTLGVDGVPLKNTRYISQFVAPESSTLTDLSLMVMAFGQYIDHDFTGFPVIKLNDSALKCCKDNMEPTMKAENGGPCFPIMINEEEDYFKGRTCMEFKRSVAATDHHDVVIYASAIYGNTEEENSRLRVEGGKLKVEANNMLPRSPVTNCKIVDPETDYCLLTGDDRVNVFVGLGIFHTLFHRLHNSLVDELSLVNPHWDAEKLYQETRKIMSALHQHITYNEYLPVILSDATLDRYRLRVGDYDYDSNLKPMMANSFSTAAYRFGHSQIQRFVKVGDDLFLTEDTLSRPHLVLTRFNEVLEGLLFQPSEQVDRFFSTSITDHLFETNATKKDGLDLVAFNTQRGRDHGLPPFNKFRSKFCGLDPVTSFDSPVFSKDNKLSKVYRHPDDIDLFIGGVSEVHLPGSIVGPTFACLLGQQFHDMKFGDRFYYETPTAEGFTASQLKEIKRMKMSSVVCMTTDIPQLQADVMFMPDDVNNPMVSCNTVYRLNVLPWKESV